MQKNIMIETRNKLKWHLACAIIIEQIDCGEPKIGSQAFFFYR